MKEEILTKYPEADIELVRGSGGNFIVEIDEKTIFSKATLDRPRFPTDKEILELIG